MRILLIMPPNPVPTSPLVFGYPLGLGYLASSLLPHGFDVAIYDCNTEQSTMSEIRQKVEEYQPHVVGISIYTALARSAVAIAKLVKELNPKTITVAGGAHATYDYGSLLLNYPFDYIVLGEGEITFLELMKDIEQHNGHKSDIKGLAYYDGGVKKTDKRKPIPDLDILPFPAYHLVKYQNYIKPQLLPNAVSIMTSRGCSHLCAFCSQSHFQHQWRGRSPDNIIWEMEYLLNVYKNIQSFQFYDDNFTFDNNRVYELCDLMIRKDLNRYKWSCLARVDQVNRELLRSMKRAGCVKISYGIESGNDTILKNIHKKLNKNLAESVFYLTTKTGMEALAFMMIGNPGENTQTIRESVRYAKRLRSTSTLWAIAQVYPGTELAEKQRLINWIEYTYQPEIDKPYPFTHPYVPVFEQFGLDREELKKWQKKLMRSFLLHHGIRNFKTYFKHFIHSPWNSLRYVMSLLG